MSLGNLILWSGSVITMIAGVHNIDSIQQAILKAQARIIYESRTETWGSPKFFKKEVPAQEMLNNADRAGR